MENPSRRSTASRYDSIQTTTDTALLLNSSTHSRAEYAPASRRHCPKSCATKIGSYSTDATLDSTPMLSFSNCRRSTVDAGTAERKTDAASRLARAWDGREDGAPPGDPVHLTRNDPADAPRCCSYRKKLDIINLSARVRVPPYILSSGPMCEG